MSGALNRLGGHLAGCTNGLAPAPWPSVPPSGGPRPPRPLAAALRVHAPVERVGSRGVPRRMHVTVGSFSDCLATPSGDCKTVGASHLAFLLGFAMALGLAPRFASAEDLNVQGEIKSYVARDQDSDGLAELWVSYHVSGQRFIGIFRGQKTYSKEPDRVIPIDEQAILYSLGDYDATPGLDLLLLSRSSGVICPITGADAAASFRKVLDTDLFFTVASRTSAPPWLSDARLDIDGDGADDLVLPERGRLRILFGAEKKVSDGAAGGTWRSSVDLPVTYYPLHDSREDKVSKAVEDFAEEDKSPLPIYDGASALAFPLFRDFDGDGRLDLIVKQPGQRLDVFRQTRPGTFSLAADVSVELAWAKKSSGLDWVDVNGDHKLDLVATELLLKDLATEVKVFVQDDSRPDHGFVEPRQAIRIEGFFRRPSLADVNGDGQVDLCVSPYRVDLLEKLKSKVVEEVELSHEVFLGTAGAPFERRPSFQERFLLRTQDLEGGSVKQPILAGHDLTGDGRPDLLFVDGGRSLRLFRSVSQRPLRFEEVKAFTEKVDDPIAVDAVGLDREPGDEIILRYERRLQIRRGR